MRLKTLSRDFISAVSGYSAGYLPPGRLDTFFNMVDAEMKLHYFTYSSESNLLRILSSMFDKVAFLSECTQYPNYLELLILISVNSNYLSDIIVRNPEYFYWIINPSNQKHSLSYENFSTIVNATLTPYKTFETKVNMLRKLKRKELLRIGVNDLLRAVSIKEITMELSTLAKVLAGRLFDLCYHEILFKYKITNCRNEYCLAALGKMGGDELNYSSDIDLILFFDRNIKIGGKEFFEIISETAYLFIEKSSMLTNNGYLYRVDFRLRPDGRTSLLCRTMQDYLTYYESRGEDWERQMLIKTSWCGGSKKLYDNFINYLKPFIYPASFLVSPTEQIRTMKNNIEKHLKEEENIKLLPGGIRDIEFSVQALQLLNGGTLPEIRTGNTLDGIAKLLLLNIITIKEAETLNSAYILFRKTEHFLQLMNDTQTHTIPEPGELLSKLSFSLGFESEKKFKLEILENRKLVRKIYSSIVGLENLNDYRGTDRIIFENRNRAEKDLVFLRTGKGILGQKIFDKKTTDSFNIIEGELLRYLESSSLPDITVANFVKVIRNIKFPSQWYKSLNDKKLLHNFLQLCTFSQKSIDLFVMNQELKDYFISKQVFEKLNLNKLKTFTLDKLLFTLSVQFILKHINAAELSKYISHYLINRIQRRVISDLKISVPFLVAAAGSLGSQEMNFSSDIDLIFIVEQEESVLDIQREFQNLLNAVRNELKPFETDCRLRPEGRNSYLVWEVSVYKEYIKERVRIWELQSLTKLKYISGSKQIFNSLNSAIIERLKYENQQTVKNEIREMRRKLSYGFLDSGVLNIKKIHGGFLDIEFMLQYILLTEHRLFNKLQGQPYIRIIEELSVKESYKELIVLKDNYIFLKHLLILNQSLFNSKGYNIDFNEKNRLIFSNLMDIESAKINESLVKILRSNNLLYNNIFGNVK